VGNGASGRSVVRNKANCAKRTQFRPSAREWAQTAGTAEGETCKTNPIGPGVAGVPAGERCKTNPISSSLTETRRPNCAKQSQTWAGWDIWGRRIRGGDCAKRTQFRRVGRRVEPPLFHYSIIPRFQSDVEGAKRTQFAACRPTATGRLTVPSHLQGARLYWVVIGNRKTVMERGRL
jgi:hypothetical protein